MYLAIDLKSFYASVECKERGLDPLTTNLVVADSGRTEKTIASFLWEIQSLGGATQVHHNLFYILHFVHFHAFFFSILFYLLNFTV